MYIPYIVKRTQIYIDEEQDRRLGRRAAAEGVTKSSIIRRAVEAYLDGSEGKERRLERFREAVREVAGSVPRLPPGDEYVEAVRRLDGRRQRELDRRWNR